MILTDEKTEEAAELFHSALINMENIVGLNPALGRHPFYHIVRMQMTEGLKLLGREVDNGDDGDTTEPSPGAGWK
jgi:hypothetical protein